MKRNLLIALLASLCAAMFNSAAFADTKCDSVVEQCHDTCVKSLNYLQKKGSKSVKASQIEHLRDCIKLCDTNVDLSKRNSQFAAQVEAICAQVCRTCAKSCEELKDPQLKDCIAMCNKCADHCDGHHHH